VDPAAQPLIILGASARAAAQSAIRAGYRPWCVDLFADRDLQALTTVRQCPAASYPMGLLSLLDEAPPDAPVLLTGALENYPNFLKALAFERPLFGSSVQAITQVRDPKAFLSLPKQYGLRIPAVKTAAGPVHRLKQMTLGAMTRQRFLVKPCASAGGQGIDWWGPEQSIGRAHYIQQYIRGQPLSAVYRADGWSAQWLGATEQFVGEPTFGADGFRYCGSIGPMPLSETARRALAQLGVVLTQQYDLRGIFGVDLVMDWRGRLWPVEINPRYPASTEIVEQITGRAALQSLREHHSRKQKQTQRPAQTHGKALLFARHPAQAPDLYEQWPDHAIADVPSPGQPLAPGKPICTIFASGATRQACEDRLRERAERIYAALKAPA
jgi:predicted ATP-grasp superfamily ATP-dependent carboligase